MMRVIINGDNWSKDINPYSVEPKHEKVQGPNSGVSMGGSKILDTVAVKNGFSATAGLLMQERYTQLMDLAKMDYVTVVYDDPDTGTESQRVMTLTAGSAKQIPLMGGGYAYKNIALTFMER